MPDRDDRRDTLPAAPEDAVSDSGAEVSKAKIFWYSPALNAFFGLRAADYQLLLLFLGVYSTEDTETAVETVKTALQDERLAKTAENYPGKTLAKRRLAELSHELLDGRYALFSPRFRKNETYGKNFRPARNLPRQAIPYYTQVLEWLFAEDLPLLEDILRKLRIELTHFQLTLPALPGDAGVPALAEAAAETLHPLLQLLARRAAGPRAACPLLPETALRSAGSREAACYQQLLESVPSDTFSFFEGLCALAQQGNPYALRELAAIYRVGRPFALCDGGLLEIPPDRSYADCLAQQAGGGLPSPRPAQLHGLRRPLAPAERAELADLADRGSLEAARLLAQAEQDPEAREDLLRPLRRSPLWANALKDCALTESGGLTSRAGAELRSLLPLFPRLEDAQLLRRLPPLLRAGCQESELLALLVCYGEAWPGWSQGRRRAHKAPLCLLLSALLAAQQELQQEEDRFHAQKGWLLPEEYRLRRNALIAREDRLLDAQSQVQVFLLSALDAGPAPQAESVWQEEIPQLDDSATF